MERQRERERERERELVHYLQFKLNLKDLHTRKFLFRDVFEKKMLRIFCFNDLYVFFSTSFFSSKQTKA